MVAEWIRVNSRSYRRTPRPAAWYSTGDDTYPIEPSDKADRGTMVVIKLKEDAAEFADEQRLRADREQALRFRPVPNLHGRDSEQANQQTAIWRKQPREVSRRQYDEFYKQFTLDFEPPLTHAHMVVDAPVQLYALLFIPVQP